MNEISLARKKMKPFLASVLFSTFREMTRGNVFSEGAQKGFWYYSLWTKQLWGESISKVLNFLEKNPTSYLFFYLLISWTSQSEIRRKLTSFVIWPQLPIFQLKSLLREAALRPKNSFEKMVSASQQMLLSFWMGQKIDHELPCGDFNASFCYVITANVILIFHLPLDVIKE